MLRVVPDIFEFVLTQLRSVFNVYVGGAILSGFFGLWVLDRIFHIFDILRK